MSAPAKLQTKLFSIEPSVYTNKIPSEQKGLLGLEEGARLLNALAITPTYTSGIGPSNFLLEYELPYIPFFIYFVKICSHFKINFDGPYLAGSLANQMVVEGRPLSGVDYDFVFDGFAENFDRWDVVEHIFLACLARFATVTCIDKVRQQGTDGVTYRHYYKGEQEIGYLVKDPSWDEYVLHEGPYLFCGQFFKSLGGLKNSLTIANNAENHILITIPTKTAGVDFYFVAKSQHQAFSNTDSRRVNLASILEETNKAYPQTLAIPPVQEFKPALRHALRNSALVVKTADGYSLSEIANDSVNMTYRIARPETLHDGFKIYVYRRIKGYLPLDKQLVEIFAQGFIREFFELQQGGQAHSWSLVGNKEVTKFERGIRRFLEKPYFVERPENKVRYLLEYEKVLSELEETPSSAYARVPFAEREKLHEILGSLIIEALTQAKAVQSPKAILVFLKLCKLHYSFIQKDHASFLIWQESLQDNPSYVSNKAGLLTLLKRLNVHFPVAGFDLCTADPLAFYKEKFSSEFEHLSPQEIATIRPLTCFSGFLAFYSFYKGDNNKLLELLISLFESKATVQVNDREKISQICYEEINRLLSNNHPRTINLLKAAHPYLTGEERVLLLNAYIQRLESRIEVAPEFEKERLFEIGYYLYSQNPFVEQVSFTFYEALFNGFSGEMSKRQKLGDLLRFTCEVKPAFLSTGSHLVKAMLSRDYEAACQLLAPFEEKLGKESTISMIDAFLENFSRVPSAEGFVKGCGIYKHAVKRGNIPSLKMAELYQLLSTSETGMEEKGLHELFEILYFAAHSKEDFLPAQQEALLQLFKRINSKLDATSLGKDAKPLERLLEEIWNKFKILSSKYQGEEFKRCIRSLTLKFIQHLFNHKKHSDFCTTFLGKIFVEVEKTAAFKSVPLMFLPSYLEYLFERTDSTEKLLLSGFVEKELQIDQLPSKDYREILTRFIQHLGSNKDPRAHKIITKGLNRILKEGVDPDIFGVLAKALSSHIHYLKLIKEIQAPLYAFACSMQSYQISMEGVVVEELIRELAPPNPSEKKPTLKAPEEANAPALVETPVAGKSDAENVNGGELMKSSAPLTSFEQVYAILSYVSKIKLENDKSCKFINKYFSTTAVRIVEYYAGYSGRSELVDIVFPSCIEALGSSQTKVIHAMSSSHTSLDQKYLAELYRLQIKLMSIYLLKNDMEGEVLDPKLLFIAIKEACIYVNIPSKESVSLKPFNYSELLDIFKYLSPPLAKSHKFYELFMREMTDFTTTFSFGVNLIIELQYYVLQEIVTNMFKKPTPYLLENGMDLYREITEGFKLNTRIRIVQEAYFELGSVLLDQGLKMGETNQVELNAKLLNHGLLLMTDFQSRRLLGARRDNLRACVQKLALLPLNFDDRTVQAMLMNLNFLTNFGPSPIQGGANLETMFNEHLLILFKTAKYDELIGYFNKHRGNITISPAVYAMVAKGHTLKQETDFEKAIEYYKTAQELYKEDPLVLMVLYELSQVYIKVNEIGKSEELIAKINAKDPDFLETMKQPKEEAKKD